MNLPHFSPKLHRAGVAAAAIAALALAPASQPRRSPLDLVRASLAAAAAETRAAVAEELERHPDYSPAKLSGWLHDAADAPVLSPGEQSMTVELPGGDTRTITLILPDGYRPDKAWPLIYALHPSGDPGDAWARLVRSMLGGVASEYVIAAPHGYRQNYIAAGPPFIPEHPAILDEVMRRVHVAGNRVYVFGYSKGAFGAWFNALFYPDRFAGAIAFAGGFDVTLDDGSLWKSLVTNVTHVPVYNAWGERDTLEARTIDDKPAGTFGEQNRRFAAAVAGLGLPIVNIEVPGGVHNSLSPPGRPMGELLRMRRIEEPRRLTHTFRHLHQASCYWLEGLSWVGDRWGETTPASVSDIEPLLGRLTGEIDGQTIRVTRRHVGDLVVWIGDRAIDWKQPVRLEVDGRVAWEGRVERRAAIALARAAATRDFDRLRWAGIRVNTGGQGRLVRPGDVPAPVWQAR